MKNGLWSALLVLCLAGAGATFCQTRLDRGSKAGLAWNRAYLFVPPLDGVRAIATGFEQVIADGFWLDFLQFNGEKIVSDKYKEEAKGVPPMITFLTDLDPRFSYAYQFGAWVLGDLEREEEGIALLDKGYRRLPDDPQIPFQRGFVEFLFRKNYLEAARWFLVADRMPNAPPRAKRMAAAMYARSNKQDLARNTWQQIYQSAADEQTRRIAKHALERLQRETE
ncbi:MAG: tetratricopeptide repeat protein [Bacteroidota bacterium]